MRTSTEVHGQCHAMSASVTVSVGWPRRNANVRAGAPSRRRTESHLPVTTTVRSRHPFQPRDATFKLTLFCLLLLVRVRCNSATTTTTTNHDSRLAAPSSCHAPRYPVATW